MDVILRHIIMRTNITKRGESISHIKFIKAIQTRENQKIGTSFFLSSSISIIFLVDIDIFSLYKLPNILYVESIFALGYLVVF